MFRKHVPFTGQEMIIKNIDNYPGITSETLFKMHFTLIDNGMQICISVNLPVKDYAFADQLGIFFIVPAFDIVADKIADFYLIRTAR